MSSITALATANTYQSANVSNLANAYTDTSSSTYGIYSPVFVEHSWLKLSGFSFASVPDNATINSITYKMKANSSANGWTFYISAKINGSTKATKTYSTTTAATIYTLTVTNSTTVADLKANPSNNFFYFTQAAASTNIRIYGLEIIVDYTEAPSFDPKPFFHAQYLKCFGGM